tara:strand:- start:2573 stop:3493 length:921 start_codon:yes stop_codon:yes gene_type:complete
MPRKNKGQKRPAADAPASEAKVAKRDPAASGPTSSSDDDGAKGKGGAKRLVLRYDEVMAAGDDSATALFELANATHVVFRVGGRELTIQQDPSVVGTGGCVWETAYLMAQWLQPRLDELQRDGLPLRCLEVGAGCGLLGVALAHAGCDVLLTEQESAMANLSANVAANAPPEASGGACAAASLSWIDDGELEAVAARGPWQVLVGTDVVYKAELVRPLLRTLWRCADSETKCWLCLQERDADAHATLLRLAPCFFRRVAPVPLDGLSFSEELECFLLSLEGRRDAELDEEQVRLEEEERSDGESTK